MGGAILQRVPFPNVELVRQALSIGPHQPEAFWDLLDDDVAWDVTAAPEEAPSTTGAKRFRRFLGSWRYGYEYWRVETEDYIDAGDRVITVFRERACGLCVTAGWCASGGIRSAPRRSLP